MFQPFGAASGNETGPSWHPEPVFRGTSNILTTCLITLGLCVWSSLHLNIPAHGLASKQWKKKIPWLLAGTFAPELVAWSAYKQFREARLLTPLMRSALVTRANPLPSTNLDNEQGIPVAGLSQPQTRPGQGGKPNRRNTWTIVHSHFACMGGFFIRDDDQSNAPKFMPPQYQRLTISREGLLVIAMNEPDLIPDIPEASIRDKSNANGLAKALVCFQASWFCIQCVVRVAQGMALTLLELNTFAHAICAIVVYLLWWNKPLDIEEPIAISGPQAAEMAGYLLMHSRFGREKLKIPEMYGATTTVVGPARGHITRSSQEGSDVGWLEAARHQPNQPVLREGHSRLYLGQRIHGFGLENKVKYRRHPLYSRWFESETTLLPRKKNEGQSRSLVPSTGVEDTSSHIVSFFAHVDLEPWEIEVLRLAQQAQQRWKFQTDRLSDIKEHLRISIPNGTSQTDGSRWVDFGWLAAFSMASTCYGLLHAIAWGAPFPTTTEGLLWRISAVTLSAAGPFVILMYISLHLVPVEHKVVQLISLIPIVLALCGYILLYVFARIDLVVQPLISLAYLPPSALLVPQWSQYVPHFT